MEFSEDMSPILETNPALSKEIAYPILKSALKSIFYCLSSYFRSKKAFSLQIWKNSTLRASRIEELYIKNSLQVMKLKVRSINYLFGSITQKAFHKVLLEIISASQFKDFESELTRRDKKLTETHLSQIEILKIKEINENNELIVLKKELQDLKKTEENVLLSTYNGKNKIEAERVQKQNTIAKIEQIHNENLDLKDKIMKYEINSKVFIQEMQNFLNKTPGYIPITSKNTVF